MSERDTLATIRAEIVRRRDAAARYLDHPEASSGAHAVTGVCEAVLKILDAEPPETDAPETP